MKRWTQINNLPIRYKLITHFLFISILPIFCLALFISWTVERVMEEQVSDNTLQLIGKVNESFEFYMNNLQSYTYMIANNENVEEFFDQTDTSKAADIRYDIQRFLRTFTTVSPEVAGIMVVNSDGAFISNELYAPDDVDLTETAWYQAAIEAEGIFSVFGRPEGRRLTSIVEYTNDDVVTVLKSVVDPFTEKTHGVIMIDLKLRVIAEEVQDITLGKNGYLMVIDEQGRNIFQPQQPIVSTVPLEWLEEQQSGSFSKTINEEKVQFIYQESPFINWTTIAVFPAEETVFGLKEINFYLVVFIFMIMLFGITVSYYLSYSISKPLVQLVSFMRKAEDGDFQVRYKGKREDEVGLLGKSFNKMVKKINQLMHVTEQQERQKREAEFRSLQANINPHFLYNTLDTIQWMARKHKANDVAEVVASLAKLFRIGLSKGHDFISLFEEIDHIDSYLKIQQTRYRDKLQYRIQVEDSIKSVPVLKFILQPIVENAIYHGIKERRGAGTIEMEAWQEKGDIKIQIKDDGKGMTEEQVTDMRATLREAVQRTEKPEETRNKKGYGMLNVQARIQLTHGEGYGMAIDSKENVGTTVTILLPDDRS
ncbi:cache domain-containing sensor histidine kinase [Gracilibacillus alcaliphilus]|uniref:cache domain-containing sensor histidine kinase n=1 Tax=Gracilibacillus alcaliphilus TaxID=1401441 RepID=UPI0019565EF4|nr:sensor histidine kinase [Gracilibacillus alcaliphilus]MBM7675666.1 two-component system sensor histidine kinase YesM [Gracilibacillus alcaliphilus]